MTIPGVIAQEWRAANLPVPQLDDIVFLSTWDGTNGGTDAHDESIIAAPLTWNGTQLSNVEHLFDAACSLRCDSLTDYVSAPANPLYDIGASDFTIESFFRCPNFQVAAGAQWVGVWQNDENNTFNQWRAISDSLRFYFQAKFNNSVLQFSFVHGMLTNTWYYFVWCRYAGVLRGFMGEPGGIATMKHRANMFGKFDAVSGIPLYIGGNPGGTQIKNGANAYFQHMRVTRGAWYRNDDSFPVPSQKFGYGIIAPHLVVDADIIPPPIIASTIAVAPLVPHDDVFLPPTIVPAIAFFNNTATNGQLGVTSGTVTLVGSRGLGALLIAWIEVMAGGKTFAVGGGWTIGDQQQDANSSSAWAWRFVDISEAAPTFTWTGAATFHGRMYQFRDTNGVSPIGVKAKAQGASSTLTVNGGLGLTTTGAGSAVFEISLVVSSSQTIPLPSGYQDCGSFADTNGSNRAGLQGLGLAGSVSSPVNITISAAFWNGFMIELKK